METQSFSSGGTDNVNPYYTIVSCAVPIVFHKLVSGVQFSLNQLCVDLSQVYVRVPFFGISFELIVSLSNVFIVVLFQMDSLPVADS